jgi:hypothetical protein
MSFMNTPMRLLATATAITTLAACGTTTVEDDADDPASELSEEELTGGGDRELAEDDVSPLDTGVIVDSDAPPAPAAVEGSAADLLPEIGIEMSRLSAEIAGDGDEDQTIALIESQWDAIQAEVEETSPGLVSGIQTTIEMARTAVDRNRPADADKAFILLNDFIDDFTGDS